MWEGLLHPSVVGGVVRDYEPTDWFGPKEVRQLDRFAQLSMVSADQAVAAAGDLGVDPAKAGVVFATGVGGFETLAGQVGVYNEKGADRVSPRLVPMMMANAGAAGISMRLGWRGPSEAICTACAAGTHAIAAAAGSWPRAAARWRSAAARKPACTPRARRVRQHDGPLDVGPFTSLRRAA